MKRQIRNLVLILTLISVAGCSTTGKSISDQGPAQIACESRSDEQVASSRGISLSTFYLLREKRSLFKQDICRISDEKLARAIHRSNVPKPDHPDEAVNFRKLQLVDEHGRIPDDGLARAQIQMRAMRMADKKKTQPDTDGAGIENNSWKSIGPGNIGGRVRSVVFHPSDADTMWIGSVSGGIWKTTNAGQSWSAVDDFMANLAVSTLAIDPANANILYAGTGEGFFNADAIRGAGVFKSIDGGTTWNQLSATANADWHYVNRLSISPASSTILLAATNTGIWRTVNAGATWVKTSSETRVYDLDFHPSDGNKAIASGAHGTFYSTNSGTSWQSAAGITSQAGFFRRSEVSYAPSNPNIVYASLDINGGEVWKSLDGGQNYTRTSTGYGYLGAQGWYDNIIWVDPTNPDTIIVGGIDLWRSTDSGITLSKISQWYSAPQSAHADHHYIIAHPDFNGTSNKTVYFANDGGIYRASDVYTVQGTSGWQELNNNLGITQFYGAAGNPVSRKIVGGTQDNGTLFYAGDAENWTKLFGGDGGFSAADPTDPNYFYGEYVYLQIHRSNNGGSSASYIYNGITDNGTANFIAPFILDPNNPNTMLAGSASLWRSLNVKASVPGWTIIKPSIGSSISAIAVAKNNSDIIWVGHNNGSVYKTTNGLAVTPTWTRMDLKGIGLPNRFVTRITVDPVDSSNVYVTFGGFTADNVYRSTDGGQSWQNRTGSGATGLPDVPVRSLVISSVNSNFLYAGTEVGIFTSEDSGATWNLPQDGPANVSVDELFWLDHKTLVAATHGRGLFTHQVRVLSDYSKALDYEADWASGGDADFVIDLAEFHYDSDSVRSGLIADGQSSYIEATFQGPGTVSFYWKVWSQLNSGVFKVHLDGVEADSISGEVDWTDSQVNLGDGTHTVRWVYMKDGGISSGHDSAWLDKVVFEDGGCEFFIITAADGAPVPICM